MLRVPAENLDKARLATTAKGAPKSGRMGFELFDNPNWMGSEFDEKVNYQRALEGELERTIGTLADVQSARVHLVLPHDSLFASGQRDAKASVVLRLRHRTLPSDEAEGIENLVAGAVDDLRPENVILVDAEGGATLGKHSASAALADREQQLEARLVETLEPVAGPGDVRASVNIDSDDTSTDEVDETYDPGQSATLSMQRSQQNSGTAPAAWGVPGTTSNGAGGKPPLYPSATNGAVQTQNEESATYAVSKKTRHTLEAPGRINRLTAAVLINDQPAKAGKETTRKQRSPAEMKQLTDLAEAAIGFDASRGDQVSVQEIAFDENAGPSAPSLLARILAMVSEGQVVLRYGTILVALLALYMMVARPALRSLATAPAARPAQISAQHTASAQPAAMPEPRELTEEQIAGERRKVRAQNVFEQVAETVNREPAQSSRLLESWIRAD